MGLKDKKRESKEERTCWDDTRKEKYQSIRKKQQMAGKKKEQWKGKK